MARDAAASCRRSVPFIRSRSSSFWSDLTLFPLRFLREVGRADFELEKRLNMAGVLVVNGRKMRKNAGELVSHASDTTGVTGPMENSELQSRLSQIVTQWSLVLEAHRG